MKTKMSPMIPPLRKDLSDDFIDKTTAKRVTLIIATTVLWGCETQIGNNLPSGRLEPNDLLRDACETFAPTDADIRAGLLAHEADRLNGLTMADALQQTFLTCQSIACQNCRSAIIQQVYQGVQ